MDIITETSSKSFTSETTFSNYGMERITTEEVMENLDMFQAIFGKVDEFGWWDLERISAYAGMQFTSTEFQDECQIRSVWLKLTAPEHQEMNRQI